MAAPVEIEISRNLPIAGLETAFVKQNPAGFPSHFHEGIYTIGLMTCGASYCRSRGDDTALTSPDMLALINPGELHTGIPLGEKPIHYWMIYIEEGLFNGLADEEGFRGDWAFRKMISRNPRLRASLLELCRNTREKDSSLAVESLLCHSVHGLVEMEGASRQESVLPANHPLLKRAQEMLSENLESRIPLEELSRELGISRYHLLRCFSKAFGMPPHQYRNQRRLETARRWIKEGLPQSEVALKTGFTDQSHFIRAFKKHFLVTPSQYSTGK